MDPLDFLVAVLWGPLKTGKTTVGLSWPTPMIHFDFDRGFHRAEPPFVASGYKIVKVPYDQPISNYLDPTAHIITKPYQLPVKWGNTVEGYIALWNTVVQDFRTAYETPWVRSLAVDTGSTMWSIRTRAHLEKAQVRNPDRIRLQQIEYGEPNTDMAAVLGACRSYSKSLVLLHHVGGIYEARLTAQGTEEIRIGDTFDGWSKSGNLVDIIMRTYKNGITTGVEVIDCGLTLAAEGKKIENATFQIILDEINRLRGTDGTPTIS